jgi:hypothetical protein
MYKDGVASSGMIFIPGFMKGRQLFRKLFGEDK